MIDSSPKIWRGGMVGAGAWSQTQLTAWADVNHAQIVALCDRHPERRDLVAQHFSVPATFDDLGTMLDEAQIDFVDICTRPYSHASLVRQVAKRGLPILCQKPFCTSIAEASELVEYCNQRTIRLMVNENYRWRAWYRQAKEVMDSGLLGDPFVASITRRVRFTLPQFEHDQAYLSDLPRLIVNEVGVHYLDTIRFLFGQPQSICARLHRVSPHMRGEDVQLLILGYKDLTCLVQNSWATVPVPGLDLSQQDDPDAPRFEIEGTLGTLCLNCDGSMQVHTDTDQQQWKFPIETIARSHVAAQQHFVDCLQSGKPFETSGASTLETLALVEAAYQSAKDQRVVLSEEFQ